MSVSIVFEASGDASAPAAELQSALEGIKGAAADLQAQFESLGNTAPLDQLFAKSDSLISSMQSIGSAGGDAASGLSEVNGAAADAGDGLGEAGSAATEAGSGMEAVGAAGDVAQAGLGAAGQAAGAFGVEAGPAVQIGQELVGTLGSLGGGGIAMAGGLAVGTLAIAGMSAAIVGGILSDTAEWGDQMGDLSDLTGITSDALAGLQIRMESNGETIETFGRSIQALSRQMESLSTSAVNDAAAAAEAHRKLAADVADASQKMRDSWRDNQDAITDATEKTRGNLDEIAEKHAETVVKIRASLEQLKSDFEEAEQTRREDFTDSEDERRAKNKETEDKRKTDAKDGAEARHNAEVDGLARIEADHEDSVRRLNQRASAARDVNSRNAVNTARQEEHDTYMERLAALKKKTEADEAAAKKKEDREAIADAKATTDAEEKAKKRFDDQEAKAKKAYDKKEAALQASLAEEEKQYAAQVAKEDERYADQLKRLGKQYEREQEMNRQHLSKIREQESGGGAAASAGAETPFEIEMKKMLTAAGLTSDKVTEKMNAIKAGTLSTADVLPLLADGFKAEYDAAQASGEKIDQAGEAMKIFGRQGYLMLGVLREGGQAFKDDAFLAAEYGVAVGPEGEKKINDYMKANAELNAEMRGIKITLATELMPIMKEWMEFITKWIQDHKEEIITAFEDIGNKLLDLGNWVKDHHEEIEDFLTSVYDGFAAIGKWFKDNEQGWKSFFLLISISFKLMQIQAQAPVDFLKSFFGFLSDWYDEHHEEINGFLGDVGDKAVDIKDDFVDAYKGVEDFFKILLGYAKDAKEALDKLNPVDAVKGAVDKIPGASVIKKVGGKAGDIWDNVPGHADGLEQVPYDNYLAYLHQGERVLTKKEAEVLKQSGAPAGSGSNSRAFAMNFYGPVTLGGASTQDDIPLIAWSFQNELKSRGG